MHKIFLSPLIFLLAALTACQSSQISEAMVEVAENERYDFVISNDTTSLANYLAEEFVYHQPTGMVAQKSGYLESVATGNPAILSANFTDLNIIVYDNFAISRGTVSIDALLNGNAMEAELLFLNVWVLRDGRLQLAARQSAFK